MVLLFMGLFALGETMLQPTVPAITNDLAPDHLRGRYNAVSAGAFQAGTILGPVVAGVLLQHELSGVYIGLLVSGCLVMVWLARLLERRITPAVNGLATDAKAASAPAPATPSAAPARPAGASLADGQTPLA
jgi:MFS family permease